MFKTPTSDDGVRGAARVLAAGVPLPRLVEEPDKDVTAGEAEAARLLEEGACGGGVVARAGPLLGFTTGIKTS